MEIGKSDELTKQRLKSRQLLKRELLKRRYRVKSIRNLGNGLDCLLYVQRLVSLGEYRIARAASIPKDQIHKTYVATASYVTGKWVVEILNRVDGFEIQE